MAQLSRWRARSREVIEAVLAALPPDAAERDARRALRAAYPFGPRAHHPYACWLREQRIALDARFPARLWRRMTDEPEIAYRLVWVPRGSYDAARFVPWVEVACGWCEGGVNPRTGCLVCGEYHERLAAAVASPEFRGLRDGAARARPDGRILARSGCCWTGWRSVACACRG